MNKPYQIIKVGGNELADAEFMAKLVDTIQSQLKDFACILVHGCGAAINELLEKTGITPQYKNGQRITDTATLEIAEMVLSGKINKQLALIFNLAGVDALGLSGLDHGLLQVEPWGDAMDLVGRITKVRSDILENLCIQGVLPILSPISMGETGRFNVNADHAAGMVAGALEAEEIIFITNVPAVLVNEVIAPELTKEKVNQLISNGIIYGGMIPKVNSALDALSFGAKKATITNIAGFEAHAGTTIITKKDLS